MALSPHSFGPLYLRGPGEGEEGCQSAELGFPVVPHVLRQ